MAGANTGWHRSAAPWFPSAHLVYVVDVVAVQDAAAGDRHERDAAQRHLAGPLPPCPPCPPCPCDSLEEKGTPVGVVYRTRGPALGSWEDRPPVTYPTCRALTTRGLGLDTDIWREIHPAEGEIHPAEGEGVRSGARHGHMASCPCRALRPRAGFTARGMTIYPPERWTKWSTVDEVYSSKSSREYSKYGTLTGVTWSIVDHRRLSRRSRRLDTDTVKLTVKTLFSHLVTPERIQLSHQFFTDVKCPCQALSRTTNAPLERSPGNSLTQGGSLTTDRSAD
eukprot:1186229-Prorocentrum_minimum.AAC.1